MSAAVAYFFCILVSAAAGTGKFLGGRAFIPVAYALFMVLVNLSACAGVFGAVCFSGYFWLDLVGRLCSWFWHLCHHGYGFSALLLHICA
jgi:hypothetical protein